MAESPANYNSDNANRKCKANHPLLQDWAALWHGSTPQWKFYTTTLESSLYNPYLNYNYFDRNIKSSLRYTVINVVDSLATLTWLSIKPISVTACKIFPLVIPIQTAISISANKFSMFPSPKNPKLISSTDRNFWNTPIYWKTHQERLWMKIYSTNVQIQVVENGVGSDDDLRRLDEIWCSLPKCDFDELLKKSLTYTKNTNHLSGYICV